MKKKHTILLIALFAILTSLLSACSKILSSMSESNEHTTKPATSFQTETITEDGQPGQTEIELTTDLEIFLEISIDTKEDDLPAIADKYGYHLGLTRYNAGTSTHSREKNYVYELYDPSQFRNEIEEKYRVNRKYYAVQITYYHANNEEDTQYIVSCAYSSGKSGTMIKQSYSAVSGTTEYAYWKQVTTVPARQDENWHSASSAEEAVKAYLSN